MNSDRYGAEHAARMLVYEQALWSRGLLSVAGIDEAGRGPLAGPVVAAAVVLPAETFIPGVDDSKRLTHRERNRLFDAIMARATAVGVGIVSHEVIDEINIYRATLRAMEEAVRKLMPAPQHLLVDGITPLRIGIPCTAIVDGDARCSAIAAASIIAKVTRDRIMIDLDSVYPGYGFAKHKGYGTLEHREAIARLGPCPIHRRSFAVKLPADVMP